MLTEQQWQEIRDTDSVYLDSLSDALGMASAAVMDGMYANGLRIVREDRADPPLEEVVRRINALIVKWDRLAHEGPWPRRDIAIGDAIAELRKLTETPHG